LQCNISIKEKHNLTKNIHGRKVVEARSLAQDRVSSLLTKRSFTTKTKYKRKKKKIPTAWLEFVV